MQLLAYLALAVAWLGQQASSKIINCHYATWATYRSDYGKFQPANIDPSLCTHISYSFFGISDIGEIMSLRPEIDFADGLDLIRKTMALKQINPNLKIMAAVGGRKEGSIKYSEMAANSAKRTNFVTSTLAFIAKFGFDGLELDWEYPAQRGGSKGDRVNFVVLLGEIQEAFEPQGLTLSIAVGAPTYYDIVSYDIPAISRHVTFINLMAYGFHRSTDIILDFNSPLPAVETAIDHWLQQGAPAAKLILGIGSYGSSYQLWDNDKHSPGDPSKGPGKAGIYTCEKGILGYNEICLNQWTTVFDETARSPYAFQNDQWVSYDNPQSIAFKMELVKAHNLGGAMLSSVATDDFQGLCGVAYPLLKAINKGFN